MHSPMRDELRRYPEPGLMGSPLWGALVLEGATRFRLWAPAVERVSVLIEGEPEPPLAMLRVEGGWHELTTRRTGAGSRYRFVLADGTRVPDPASRFQPEDVQGPSEVIDTR